MPNLSLPDKILYSKFNGEWSIFIDAVYSHFHSNFVISKPKIANRRVGLKKHPQTEGKEATFWHFISDGKIEQDRLPDIPRTECVPWIKPLMENYKLDNIRVWSKDQSTPKGRDVRVLIALEDFSYLVVLSDRGDFVLPWTAYPVDFQNRRDRLEKEYMEFKKKLGSHYSYDPFTPSTTR